MFDALFRHAQATVEQTVGQVIARVVTAIPFVVAAAFGVAALSLRLTRVYGAETAMTMMAAGFAILGLLMALYLTLTRRSAVPTADAAQSAAQPREDSAATPAGEKRISEAEWELTLAALTVALPAALPALIRLAMRNVPLLAVVAGIIYVFTRPASGRQAPGDELSGDADAASNDNSSFAPEHSVAAE